jgi:hypothetical protein
VAQVRDEADFLELLENAISRSVPGQEGAL